MVIKKLNRLICLIPLVIVSCVKPQNAYEFKAIETSLGSLVEFKSPAASNTGEPNLFVSSSGVVYLSWIETDTTGFASLFYSLLEDYSWSEPALISEGNDWFVNWADFPSLVVGSNGLMTAHWLVKRTAETYDYDIWVSQSTDGKDWIEPFLLNRDNIAAEHGFVSLIPFQENQVLATWLDGRKSKENPESYGPMTLRVAAFDSNGNFGFDLEVDDKVCECCVTDAVNTSFGPVIVYRDRTDREIRDISLIRMGSSGWTKPRTVHQDDWEINGCPVNGPAIDFDSGLLGVTWFTQSNDTPKVLLSWSNDGGDSFNTPVRIDLGNPLGRVDLIVLSNKYMLVSWLEIQGKQATIMMSLYDSDGKKIETVPLVQTDISRASGFPLIVKKGDQIIMVMTDAGEADQVRTFKLDLKKSLLPE